MNISRLAGLACVLAGGLAQAQDVKVNVAIETWYTQMLDSNLRLNSAAPGGYMTNPSLDAGFKENGFALRRSEVYLAGKVSEQLTWGVMFDPNNSTTTVGNNILQDAWMNYQVTPALALRIGQFKPVQTWEASMVGTTSIMFYQRSMGSRMVGDRRDRGILATYGFGSASAFNGKFNVGLFNGTSDDGSSGKNADVNAQKDLAMRLEMGYGKDHKFGIYTRNGSSDAKDAGTLVAGTSTAWGASAPTAAAIRDNRDKTSNLGVYYVYETSQWQLATEVITGLLGRRNPTVFATPTAVKREHLDQKFLAYTFTGIYKMGQHQLTARYDYLNYNQGDDLYAGVNPYHPTTGLNAGSDFTPKFTEAILGYNYLFVPGKYTSGKLKLNYIHRSKNFLAPRAGQVGEQGGDSLVCSVMIGF